MSKETYLTIVQKKLERINTSIDFKILNGLNYQEEARRHKMLLDQVRKLRRKRIQSSPLRFLFS